MRLWLKKRMDARYVDQLIQAHLADDMDNVVDRRVERTLFAMRMRAIIAPWLTLGRTFPALVRTLWSYGHGRYRRAREKIYRGSTKAASAGAGAGSLPQVATTYTPAFSTIPAVSSAPAPTAPQTFEDAGIRAGEVVAYRCWVLKDDGLLYSAYQSEFVWTPGDIIEGDPTKFGEGVHGFKDRISAVNYLSFYESSGCILVSGTVELWGDVYEHQRGYRASKAVIASIDDSPNYDAVALRKLYKVGRKRKK